MRRSTSWRLLRLAARSKRRVRQARINLGEPAAKRPLRHNARSRATLVGFELIGIMEQP